MPSSVYGQANPAAVDPWPIESTLAPLAVGHSQAEAQNMLDMYQMQREAQGNVYGQELQQQHDFAKQQLSQQLYEARLKAMSEVGGKTGGAALIAGGGLPGIGVDMGGDPNAIARWAAANNTAEAATNLQHAGAGYASASAGGFQMNPEYVPGLQGVPGKLGEPERIAAERIRAQGMIDAARIRAASGGGDPRLTATLPVSEATGNMPMSTQSRKGETPTDFAKRLQSLGVAPAPVKPPPGPGVTPPPAPTGAPASSGATNLPPAAKDTGSRVQNTASGADKLQRVAEDYVEKSVRLTNPDAYKDIKAQAARNGGRVQLVGPDKNGGYAIQGLTQLHTQL